MLPRLRRLLERYGLPDATAYSAQALYEKTLSDKKRSGDTISLVVPIAWGAQPAGADSRVRTAGVDRKGAGPVNVTIQPGAVAGTVAAIPSKSAAHRLLICAALADRPTG